MMFSHTAFMLLRIISSSLTADFLTKISSCLSLWMFALRIEVNRSRLSLIVCFEYQRSLSLSSNSWVIWRLASEISENSWLTFSYFYMYSSSMDFFDFNSCSVSVSLKVVVSSLDCKSILSEWSYLIVFSSSLDLIFIPVWSFDNSSLYELISF